MRIWGTRPTLVGLLTAALLSLAVGRAEAASLPNTPIQIGDSGGTYIAIYPFGGLAQNDFKAIAPGQLRFTLNMTGVDPDLLDPYAVVEVRMDVGFQGGDLHDVNIVGPVSAGTDDEGQLIGGTLSMFDITKWAYATDGTPISLSYFATLAPGVQGTLSVNFIPTAATTPVPDALPLVATGLGALGLLTWRKKRRYPAGATV
jgi:hypothetical protein